MAARERPFLNRVKRAEVSKPFNGLREISRTWKVASEAVKGPDVIEEKCFLPYGTADDEFPLALLVDAKVGNPGGSDPNSSDRYLYETYKEFKLGQKVHVGDDVIGTDSNGRKTTVRRFVALATEAEGLAAKISDTWEGNACAGSKVEKQGIGALITETYVEASDAVKSLIEGAEETGKGDEVWQDENNRHRRKRTYIQKASAVYNEPQAGTHIITVEGVKYVNVGEHRGGDAAVRTIEREFQEATAEWVQVGPAIPVTSTDGLRTLDFVQVRIGHVTTTDNPVIVVGTSSITDAVVELKLFRISGEGSSVAISRRVLTYKQPGVLRTSDNVRNNGKLILRSITAFCMVPPTPDEFVAVDAGVDDPGGAPTRTYSFARGEGLISFDKDTGVTGGLLAYNTRYLTPYIPPVVDSEPANPTPSPKAGALVASESWSDADGYVIWSTRWIVGGKVELDEDEDGRTLLEATYLYLVSPDNADFPKVSDAVEPIMDETAPPADGDEDGGGEAATAVDGSPHLRESEKYVYAGRREGAAYGYKTVTLRFQEATDEWQQVGESISDWEMNGLERMMIRFVARGGTEWTNAEAATIGVTPIDGETETLYLAGISRKGTTRAIRRLTYTYLQPGIVRNRTRQIPGGLREITIETFHWGRAEIEASEGEIPGIPVVDDTDNPHGYPLRQLRWIQTADGGDPTNGIAQTYNDQVQFTYPGRARPYWFKRNYGASENTIILPGGGVTIIKTEGMPVYFFSILMSPPADVMVPAKIEITYSDSPELELKHPLWNPTDWAVLQSTGVWSNDEGWHQNSGLRGYRTDTDGGQVSSQSEDMGLVFNNGERSNHFGTIRSDIGGNGIGGNGIEFSYPVAIIDGRSTAFDPEYRGHAAWEYNSSKGWTGTLGQKNGPVFMIAGGPPKPDEKTWILSHKPEPAFVDEDGQQYWRHTVVVSTIPKQATPLLFGNIGIGSGEWNVIDLS